ncbi:hypothetical protein QQF64_004085, partial [Cirrhinus molitorella]
MFSRGLRRSPESCPFAVTSSVFVRGEPVTGRKKRKESAEEISRFATQRLLKDQSWSSRTIFGARSRAFDWCPPALRSREQHRSFHSSTRMSQKERPTFYRQELNKTIWEVPERYQGLSPVGSGAYGTVCSALDSKTGLRIAVKKLSRPFQSIIHAKRTYRELRLLKHMKHENVIGLLDVFTPATCLAGFNDVYLVTHLMGADLNNIVKCQKLTDDHVQFLIYQILRGLKYIHSAEIIHRDLKPSNLAVNEDCELKILDFGLARLTDDEMTGYVATRWYRAPEIMLNWMHYNMTVDIWSVGCIMAELLTGRTLFPGTD